MRRSLKKIDASSRSLFVRSPDDDSQNSSIKPSSSRMSKSFHGSNSFVDDSFQSQSLLFKHPSPSGNTLATARSGSVVRKY